MSMALGAWDHRSNFFFSPPAHLCAVTNITETVECDVKLPIQPTNLMAKIILIVSCLRNREAKHRKLQDSLDPMNQMSKYLEKREKSRGSKDKHDKVKYLRF